MKRSLGFVLMATVESPPGSPHQAVQHVHDGKPHSVTTPASRRQHFIWRGWPPGAMGAVPQSTFLSVLPNSK